MKPGRRPRIPEAGAGFAAATGSGGLNSRPPRPIPYLAHLLALCLGIALAGLAVDRRSMHAESLPAVDLGTGHAVPREVNETVQQAVARDYASAWQSLEAALATGNAAILTDSFIGFAQDQVTQRIRDQERTGLKTRIVDRGHKVEVIFYSPEGAAIELRDEATLDTRILAGEETIHSERARVYYYALLTGAEDRWKVRVLESAAGPDGK